MLYDKIQRTNIMFLFICSFLQNRFYITQKLRTELRPELEKLFLQHLNTTIYHALGKNWQIWPRKLLLREYHGLLHTKQLLKYNIKMLYKVLYNISPNLLLLLLLLWFIEMYSKFVVRGRSVSGI